MKNILLFGLALFCTSISAQKQDTIFYNEDWEEVNDKQYAEFYRWNDVEKNLIRDYYISGDIQMIQEVVDLEDEVKNGTTTWYHESGEVSAVANYKKGKLHGASTSFEEDGTQTTDFNYEDGELLGPGKSWYKDGTPYLVYDYKEGENTGRYTSFYHNGKVQKEGDVLNDERTGEWLTYTDDGKKHVTYTYSQDEIIDIELHDEKLGLYEYTNYYNDSTETYEDGSYHNFNTQDEFKVARDYVGQNVELFSSAKDHDHFKLLLGYTSNWYASNPKLENLQLYGNKFTMDYLLAAMGEDSKGSLILTFFTNSYKYQLEHFNRKPDVEEIELENTKLIMDVYQFLLKEGETDKIAKLDKLIKLDKKGKLESYIKNY